MSEIRNEYPENFANSEDYTRPFRVVVVQDLRDPKQITASGSQDDQPGWCLGMYEYPDTTKKRPEGETRDLIELEPEQGDEGEVIFYNPLIYTDAGVYLWGVECWFRDNKDWMKDLPREVALAAIELQKQRIRAALGIDIEYSLN